MTLLLAAVGATVAALFELTVGPYLRVGTAQPHLVLVLGIVVTVAVGLEAGLVWAFVGGLALDVLAQRPLGSTSFALLLCVGAPRSSPGISSASGRSCRSSRPSLLSLVYLDDPVRRLRRPPAADPGRGSGRARPAERGLRHRPCRARSARSRSRSMTVAPMPNGWTGDRVTSTSAPKPRPQPLAVPHLRPHRRHRRQRPHRPAVLPPDRRRRTARDARRRETARSSSRSVARAA